MIEAHPGLDHVPFYDEDLFSPGALQNPFPHYAAIRDLGAMVRLKSPDVLAIGRYDDARRALQSPEILVSGKGIGFNDFVNQPVPEPGILTSDGERHRKLRSALTKQLSPAALKLMREIMNLARMEMEVLLEALVSRVVKIEADEATVGSNNGLFGFDRLPLRFFAA